MVPVLRGAKKDKREWESRISALLSHIYIPNTKGIIQTLLFRVIIFQIQGKISILNNGDLNVDQKNNRDDDFCHNQAALLCVQNTLPAIHLPTTPLAMWVSVCILVPERWDWEGAEDEMGPARGCSALSKVIDQGHQKIIMRTSLTARWDQTLFTRQVRQHLDR